MQLNIYLFLLTNLLQQNKLILRNRNNLLVITKIRKRKSKQKARLAKFNMQSKYKR